MSPRMLPPASAVADSSSCSCAAPFVGTGAPTSGTNSTSVGPSADDASLRDADQRNVTPVGRWRPAACGTAHNHIHKEGLETASVSQVSACDDHRLINVVSRSTIEHSSERIPGECKFRCSFSVPRAAGPSRTVAFRTPLCCQL